MRDVIEASGEIIRKTLQLISESDVAIERLRLLPNSHPCRSTSQYAGGVWLGASLTEPPWMIPAVNSK